MPSGVRRNKRSRVVSIALPPALLERVDALQRERGYSGRSETVRAGLQALFQRLDEDRLDGGDAEATVTLCYEEQATGRVASVRHAFGDVVRTMIHSHRSDHSCVEVLVVQGPAVRIRGLLDALRGREGVATVHGVVLPAERRGAPLPIGRMDLHPGDPASTG